MSERNRRVGLLSCALRRAIVAVMLSTALAGCDKSKEDDPPLTEEETPGTTPRVCDLSSLQAYSEIGVTFEPIVPSETAASGEVIDDQVPLTQHFLVKPDDGRPLREELFVWLPGSGSEPEHYKHIMNIAAFAGYRGISFAYMNEFSVDSECGVREAPDGSSDCNDESNFNCEEEVREEIIYGDTGHDSQCTSVSRANSIENRLIRLIQYLHVQHPGEGYDAYLDTTGQGVDWAKIVIAGWSQGGGHAGLIARDHAVARAIFISKGAGAVNSDNDPGPEPAPWAGDPRATPPERQFGSTHEQEKAWDYSPEVFRQWGLGDHVRIDAWTNYPDDYAQYNCTHFISTIAPPATCSANDPTHASMATDDCLSLDAAGVPILAPAYYYFFAVDVPEPP